MDFNKNNRRLFFKKEFLYEILTISLLISVFSYILIRAITLSITYDEAYTYLFVRKNSLLSLIITPPLTANNHYLNSILIKICISFFGDSEIILRIPALLGCLLYLIGTYLISKLLFKKIFIFINFLILVLNPIILDLLGLCRGYSLGLGFMMIGIYFFFMRLLNKGSAQSNNFISFSMLTLSVFSILTFIYVLLAIVLICVSLELKNFFSTKNEEIKNYSYVKKSIIFFKTNKNTLIYPLLPNILLLSFLFGFFALSLFLNNKFNYGATSFCETINSLIEHSTYDFNFTNIPFFEIFNEIFRNNYYPIFWIFLLIPIIVVIYVLISKILIPFIKHGNIMIDNVSFLGSISLLSISIFMVFLHYLIQSLILLPLIEIFSDLFALNIEGSEFLFISGRTAIFLIPIFNIFLITLGKFIFDYPKRNNKIRVINKSGSQKYQEKNKNYSKYDKKFYVNRITTQIYFIIFLSFIVFNACINCNLKYTYIWKSNASIKNMMHDLIEHHSENSIQTEVVYVYSDWLLSSPIEYYIINYNLSWINLTYNRERDYSEYDYTYYCLYINAIDMIAKENLTIINYYPLSNIYLARI